MHATALPNRSIRPLIVDGHDATRIGYAVLLRRQPWVAHCLLARDGREGSALASRHRPEVALLDISNAGPFIESATAALRAAHPGVSIVLTSRCLTRLSDRPERFGAAAFVPPEASGEHVLAAVRSAVLAAPGPAPPRIEGPHPQLGERDRRLLALISTGRTNREIAAELALSPDAVKKNASALYRKLGVRNRTEAAQRAPELLQAVAQ
jgi:DNA-binding NarL/FixJ family response regulator